MRRQDGCTCGSAPLEVAHLPGCPVVPMRTREEVEAEIKARLEDHMTAVGRWAINAERDRLWDLVEMLPSERLEGGGAIAPDLESWETVEVIGRADVLTLLREASR